MIKGYDSWGNINPAPDSMKFVGLCFNDFGNPLRKHYMFDDQYALAKSQGKLVVAYTMWRGDLDPVATAEWVLRNLPDDVVVIPDYEDKWHAIRGIKSIVSIQAYGKILHDAGRYDASYTANWWWDDYITPYDLYFTKGNLFNPYDLPLWICDPAPYGKNPGDWVSWAMRQNAIEQQAPWASAAVDWDEMTEVFYDVMMAKYHGAPVPTPPVAPTETITVLKSTADDLRAALS